MWEKKKKTGEKCIPHKTEPPLALVQCQWWAISVAQCRHRAYQLGIWVLSMRLMG